MKACVFCFSGTGNTELVAKMIQSNLAERGCETDFFRMEDVTRGKIDLAIELYDLIGIGAQVIGFGAPALVSRFIRMLPKVNGKRVFVFRTAGGVAPINYNASKPMIRKLRRKGYDVFHERLFSINSNWINRFDDEVARGLYHATQKKVSLMSDAVLHGVPRVLKTGLLQQIMMESVMAVSKLFFRFVGRDFSVSDACTHCGRCVRNCPAENIIEKNGKISYRFSCNSCLRCLYECPQNAIHLRSFAFFAVPGGYKIKDILAGKTKSAGEQKPEPRFYQEYCSNDLL
jgi:flavodoxin/ferredoxin